MSVSPSSPSFPFDALAGVALLALSCPWPVWLRCVRHRTFRAGPRHNATCVASCEAGFVGLCAHEEKARYSCYMTQGLLECHEGILDHDQQPDVCEAENAAVTSCLCESEVVQCP